MRKWTLRDDLRIARLRRIRDVSLYEAALECADESAVTKGLAVIAATVIGGVSAIAAAAAFLL
jgi:precorrin-4 methylase